MNLLRETRLGYPLGEAVQKVGFRKWYERELLSSHAHMVLAVLAVVGMLGSLEALHGGSFNEQLMNLGFVLVTGIVGYWALRRYLTLLMRAEGVANQAQCDDCGAYGRFKVIGEDRRLHETSVCCLKCAHRWTIACLD